MIPSQWHTSKYVVQAIQKSTAAPRLQIDRASLSATRRYWNKVHVYSREPLLPSRFITVTSVKNSDTAKKKREIRVGENSDGTLFSRNRHTHTHTYTYERKKEKKRKRSTQLAFNYCTGQLYSRSVQGSRVKTLRLMYYVARTLKTWHTCYP